MSRLPLFLILRICVPAEAPSNKYNKAALLADALQKGEKEEPGVHYRVDEKQKSVLMTDEGYEEAEEALGVRISAVLLRIPRSGNSFPDLGPRSKKRILLNREKGLTELCTETLWQCTCQLLV